MRKKRYSIDLAGNMAECEANYARLMQLLPDMQTMETREFGVELPGNAPTQLQITVTERCKYTTMIDVSQSQSAVAEQLPAVLSGVASFSLRIYHDARMAEVIAFNRHRRIHARYDYPNDNMYQRDEKAQLNKFLGEWLSHCLKYGHVLDDPSRQVFSRA